MIRGGGGAGCRESVSVAAGMTCGLSGVGGSAWVRWDPHLVPLCSPCDRGAVWVSVSGSAGVESSSWGDHRPRLD